jgi:hypothetical protein
MTLSEALAELEQAAIELGDDAPLEGDLLDLAVLALALHCPELWRENDMPQLCILIPRRPTHAMS